MSAVVIALLVAAGFALLAGIECVYDEYVIPELCGRCQGSGREIDGQTCIVCLGDGRPWR